MQEKKPMLIRVLEWLDDNQWACLTLVALGIVVVGAITQADMDFAALQQVRK